MSRVPGGAPLPPCLPLARLPTSAPPLPPCLRMTGLPVLAPLLPQSCCLPPMMSSAGAPSGIWKVKPLPLGVRACGLPLKPASIALSMAPTMACPDICAIIGVTATCSSRSLMLSVGTLMVCVNAAEVLATLLGSPPYCAVIEWLPTASEEVVKVAVPAASVPVPICVPPSKKITVPVGENPVTLAVNVTDCPKLEGFFDEDSAVVVATMPISELARRTGALLPPEFVTVTSTVPLPAGEVAMIDVALLTVNEVAAVPPNRTAVAPVKLLPVMVTGVPPAAGPLFGEIDVTVGAARKVNWSAELAALVPPKFVTVTSTVPLPAGEVAAIDVALLTVNEVAAEPPNCTAVARMKLLPVMITGVPPVAGPLFGEIEVTSTRTCAWASRLAPATNATSATTIMPAARIVQTRLRIATVARPQLTPQPLRFLPQ